MLNLVSDFFTAIVNSVVVNAVLDLVTVGYPVALLGLLLGLVLVLSVDSILCFVKNSIPLKAMIGIKGNLYGYP